jgi:hypothetical protein
MPKPNGVIIVIKGNFARPDTCDREFHKISEFFGMRAEFLQLGGSTGHNISPYQAFDAAKGTKED